MKMINIHEAKTHLSRLIDEIVMFGEPLIIAKSGKPLVKVIPFDTHQKKPNALVSLPNLLLQKTLMRWVKKKFWLCLKERKNEILLDTHLLIWAAGDSTYLSAKAKHLINNIENQLFFRSGKYLGNYN